MLHHEHMHAAWSKFEWICNTLIFFFAGLAAADRSLKAEFSKEYFYQAVVFYILVMVIRSAMVFLLFPILSNGTMHITPRDSVFMVW